MIAGTIVKQPRVNKLLHTRYRVNDLERTVKFYRDVLGLEEVRRNKSPRGSELVFLRVPGSDAPVAASFCSPVKLVGGIGDDFPKKYIDLYRRHKIELSGLQREPGKTFHWSGEYELNMNNRRTLLTELGVFENFTPRLPDAHKTSPFVLLANIAPSLQAHVLDQMQNPKFIVADTMDLWLNIALKDLLV